MQRGAGRSLQHETRADGSGDFEGRLPEASPERPPAASRSAAISCAPTADYGQ